MRTTDIITGDEANEMHERVVGEISSRLAAGEKFPTESSREQES